VVNHLRARIDALEKQRGVNPQTNQLEAA
jgi:hypothetical protein